MPSALTLKKLKYTCLHNKFALLMGRHSLNEEREIFIKEFSERLGKYI